jgi:hypothetical protein
MKAARLAAVLLLVVSGALAGAVVLAEEPAKDKDPTGQAAKDKDAKKDGKPASPAQPAPAEPATAPEASAEPAHVYTNDDLDRLAPRSSSPSGAPAAAGGLGARGASTTPAELPDPLKQIADDKARAAERQTRIAEAEKNVAAAEARIKDLERQELAVKNPYLPRPQVPADQADQWKKMNGGERLKATDEQIRQARKEAADARAELDRARSGG